MDLGDHEMSVVTFSIGDDRLRWSANRAQMPKGIAAAEALHLMKSSGMAADRWLGVILLGVFSCKMIASPLKNMHLLLHSHRLASLDSSEKSRLVRTQLAFIICMMLCKVSPQLRTWGNGWLGRGVNHQNGINFCYGAMLLSRCYARGVLVTWWVSIPLPVKRGQGWIRIIKDKADKYSTAMKLPAVSSRIYRSLLGYLCLFGHQVIIPQHW